LKAGGWHRTRFLPEVAVADGIADLDTDIDQQQKANYTNHDKSNGMTKLLNSWHIILLL
jgi:hypothetical protein